MRRLLILVLLSVLLSDGMAHAATKNRPRLSSSAGEMVREMNLARQHPDVYAANLEELRGCFRGNILLLPGGTILRTREGIGAVDEAIRFLRRTRPLAPLTFSPGISFAAAEHVADQASGAFGHAGSDRSDAGERMNRHGTWSTLWGENISYGKSTARDVVIALIIDDGLRGRKHRKNIFNRDFHFAGAAAGPHARYRTVWSIDFAGGYVENGAETSSLIARN
jgi:hypothetical protein